MFNKLHTIVYSSAIGASVLHVILGFFTALQSRTLREMGIFFTIMSVMAFIAVIGSAFIHPLYMVGVLVFILIPGMLISALTSVILYGGLIMLFAAPLNFFWMVLEYITTHYFIFIL